MIETSLVVTGKHFLVSEARAFEPVLEELLGSAETEILVMAYVITPSALPFLDKLNQALMRGIKVKMIINALSQHEPQIIDALETMGRTFSHYQLYDFSRIGEGVLHAKVIVADRRSALIGSANFTWGGFVGNHEVGILVQGRPAWALGKIFDRACTHFT